MPSQKNPFAALAGSDNSDDDESGNEEPAQVDFGKKQPKSKAKAASAKAKKPTKGPGPSSNAFQVVVHNEEGAIIFGPKVVQRTLTISELRHRLLDSGVTEGNHFRLLDAHGMLWESSTSADAGLGRDKSQTTLEVTMQRLPSQNLYKVMRPKRVDADPNQYRGFICTAASPDEACRTHPNMLAWQEETSTWHSKIDEPPEEHHGWTTDIHELSVELMGSAHPAVQGVLMTEFARG